MSEVKRYTFAGAAGLYVYQADFDAALAREAALQARLTVADQQVDDLQAELTKAREVIGALTKGFNTLDQVGGKYSINMSFAHRDDAWDAYSKLCKFNKLARQPALAAKDDDLPTDRGELIDLVMRAADAYWNADRKIGGPGAVKWIRDDETHALFIYTRGEYEERLRSFVMSLDGV